MENHFCKKCSTVKPVVEFSKTKSTYKGKTYVNIQSACKACIRDRWKAWKGHNPEKARQKCLEEWKPTKSPIPWHSLREKSNTKYTRTDIAVTKSTIHICECGNRYLKTRNRQARCLSCIANFMVLSTGNSYGTARTIKTILL